MGARFAIRLKEGMLIHLESGAPRQFRSLLRKRRRGCWTGLLGAMEHIPRNLLQIEAKIIKGGKLLIVAAPADQTRSALTLYRKRWGVECLFADAKTRDFNIEGTHITDPGKLNTLIAVLALATVWAYRCATQSLGSHAIPKKAPWKARKIVLQGRLRHPQKLDQLSA